MPTPSPALRGAAIIEEAFRAYIEAFQRFTLQARLRFEARDWPGGQQDAADRLDVYASLVGRAVEQLRDLLDEATRDKGTWREMKDAYMAWVRDRTDAELAETFFNSITRRIFVTVGVDADLEFDAAADALPDEQTASRAVCEEFPCRDGLARAVAHLLRRHEFSVGYDDLDGDAARVAEAISAQCAAAIVSDLQVIRTPFFRNTAAYLVGRVRTDRGDHPLTIVLLNRTGRVTVDAVLLTEDEVSVVFSFTRSYFFVDATRPASIVAVLRAIMPRKPPSELYTAIGHSKHGKTVFYRSLLRHLDDTDEVFDEAPGVRGMVMIVFTMPSFDAVFKIIRDHFPAPKTATRDEVLSKYDLVFRHDRAGRLADAQVFEHVRFDRRRFTPALLDELSREAAGTVTIDAESVVVHHVYTERKMVPLDMYLAQADRDSARRAILDYGEALRDLAATNIFPGDLLLKNFGVTRHQRLVFYDYDELCLLTDCRFRALPAAQTDDEALATEPWFHVGPHDIFPEEFLPFLGVRGDVRDVFLDAHAELLTPGFWQREQERRSAGVIAELLPYDTSRRLSRG